MMRLALHSLLLMSWRESVRSRLPWLVAATLLGALALGELAASLAVIEQGAHRAVFYAGAVRLALAALLVLHVASAVVREMDDGVLDLLLSRPVSRPLWYASRLLAGTGLALGAALLAALPLTVMSGPTPALAWAGGLACELVLLVAAALACAVALRQVTGACAAVGAFYLLGRSVAALTLMSADAAADATGLADRVLAFAVQAIALLLPDLAAFAPGRWLVYEAPAAGALAAVVVQTALYGLLLTVVGLVDFERGRA